MLCIVLGSLSTLSADVGVSTIPWSPEQRELNQMEATGPCGDLIKLTQSASGAPSGGVSFVDMVWDEQNQTYQTCASVDYAFARSFDLCEHPETRCSGFKVHCVEFYAHNEAGNGAGVCTGIGGGGGPVTLTVNIYKDEDRGAPDLPGSDLTLLGSSTVIVPLDASYSPLVATFSSPVDVDCGSQMVVEVSVPSEEIDLTCPQFMYQPL
jgi:hypothetical protein